MNASSKSSRIWRRTLIGSGMVLGLAITLALGATAYGTHVILWAGVLMAALSSRELSQMRISPEHSEPYWSWLCAVCVGLWIERSQPDRIDSCLDLLGIAGQTSVIVLVFAAWISVMHSDSRVVPRGTVRGRLGRLLLLGWILLPLPWAGVLRGVYGPSAIAALIALSKIGDIVGLYVGSWIGRSHPFPRISPGKTLAGCVGSLLAGVCTGGLFQWLEWLPPANFSPWIGCLTGLLINLSAQAGDLFESWIKRQAGVKDSGRVFGAAGGVLDMVDSLLFSVPCAFLTWPLIYGCQ